ncbi:disease resistance protein, partial [Trifolium medium]|nr:disease resistance protein [Trifolium medium]
MTCFKEYESVPHSVVSSLLNNLISLSSTDFGKTYGVEDLLENIRYIKSKLPDVDVMGNQEGDVLQWLRSSKPLLLAADDLFDDIATDNLLLPNPLLNSKRKVQRFFSSSNLCFYRSRIARELIEAKKNVNDIVKGMRQLKLSQGHESSLREISTKGSNVFSEGVIVGREKEKSEIIEQLMQQDGEENLAVIGIIGLGGIGKTTLARMV